MHRPLKKRYMKLKKNGYTEVYYRVEGVLSASSNLCAVLKSGSPVNVNKTLKFDDLHQAGCCL